MTEVYDGARPQKRVKLSGETATEAPEIAMNDNPIFAVDLSTNEIMQDSKELEVGITAFVSRASATFSGVLKKRYTDFLVNEILPNGQVLHLQDTTAGKRNRNDRNGGNSTIAQHRESVVVPAEVHNAAKEESLDVHHNGTAQAEAKDNETSPPDSKKPPSGPTEVY